MLGPPETVDERQTRQSMGLAVMIMMGVFGLGWVAWTSLTYARLQLGGYASALGRVTSCHMGLGRNESAVVTLTFPVPNAGTAELSTHSSARFCDQARNISERVLFRPGDPDVAMTAAEFDSAPWRLTMLGLFSALFSGGGLLVLRSRNRAAVSAEDTLRDTPR
jgi:hypothetical protein